MSKIAVRLTRKDRRSFPNSFVWKNLRFFPWTLSCRFFSGSVLRAQCCLQEVIISDFLLNGPVAQLVRAPPCHGGGRGFESHPGRYLWDLSSAGRASALQAEGHRFEPYRSHSMVDNESAINLPIWLNWQSS